jgi:hypothetical protein
MLICPRKAGDGYPSPFLIELAWYTAHEVLPASAPTPSVVPSEDGGVEFVWHKRNWDIELDVEPGGSSVWARNRETGETWSGVLGGLRERLSDLLVKLSDA